MKKNCSTKLILKEKWRIALPGILWTKNEEEFVYQASSKGKMKKNCSTRPSLNQKTRRIGLQERPLVAQSRKNTIPHDNCALWEMFFFCQARIWTKTITELVHSLSRPKMKKNCSTKAPLKGKWRRIALPGSLYMKNEEELLYQACSKGKMKKNCSTRPSLDQKWRRIALPSLLSKDNEEEFLIISLPDFLYRKNGVELLYQALSKRKMKQNCSTMLPR